MSQPRNLVTVCALTALLATAGSVQADGGLTFTEIADDPATGIDYHRVVSDRNAGREFVLTHPVIPFADFGLLVGANHPFKGHGAPGVALFDYDLDGDLDIYATNGPGAANSLYSNQFAQTGQVTFVDVAVDAGVDATSADSSGVCFGDIDNDGDDDLYVVSSGDPNHLFENLGDGTFADITETAGVAGLREPIGGYRYATSCALGDIDNDGRLDILVANAYNWRHRLPFGNPYYGELQHNYLFRNVGGNEFADESAARGFHDLANLDSPVVSGASWTWALTAVDYDQDGDLDVIFMDNQGGGASNRDEERGWMRLMVNDGSGHFTDQTEAHALDIAGGWMGVDFADFNCDGHLDFFVTEVGYMAAGFAPSRWFLGSEDGPFVDSLAGDLNMTPFGWGASAFDYDNDGDHDVLYHGGMDSVTILIADNPGALLVNEGLCSADFDYDADAILKDHRQRIVHGMAVGDLNNDGFEDMVSVSNLNFDRGQFFFPIVGAVMGPTGSPFDDVAAIQVNFAAFLQPGSFVWTNPPDYNDGTLSVEISSADNGNGWVNVELLGGVGLANGATVNRNGIGAVVSFTPLGGPTSLRPVAGGSSYASQDELSARFGLGAAPSGTVEVLWPGGVRNRIDGVSTGENVLFPEIPCSYDGDWNSRGQFRGCVTAALQQYRPLGLTTAEIRRIENSMLRAYDEAND